jgi:hypothetical protein
MADPISLTHPETGEVWTSGKRGRKPLWVCALMAGEPLPKVEAASKRKNDDDVLLVPGALRIWKLVGVAGETGDNDKHQQRGHCMIVAGSPVEAILTANPTFLNPMGSMEIKSMWSEIEDAALINDIHASGIDVTKTGIYEGTTEGWKPRPKLH